MSLEQSEIESLQQQLAVARALYDTQTALLSEELGIDARDPKALLERIRLMRACYRAALVQP
jgi:ABC-type polar amino acid transport system ATPase subunit